MTTPVNVTEKPTPRQVAAGAYGTLPDWIDALVAEVERTNGSRTAARLGYSPSVISQVLRASYPGVVAKVEATVRGALMGETVQCPALDGMDLRRDQCLREQEMPLSTASPLRMRFWRECRAGCPHSRIREADDGAL